MLKKGFFLTVLMVVFTKKGLEFLTNKAIHETIQENKIAKKEEVKEEKQETKTEEPKEEQKPVSTITYGEDSRRLFVSSSENYHTFTTTNTNQLQCTCCPEPILLNANDLDVSKKDKESYLSPSIGSSSSYLNITKTKERSKALYSN